MAFYCFVENLFFKFVQPPSCPTSPPRGTGCTYDAFRITCVGGMPDLQVVQHYREAGDATRVRGECRRIAGKPKKAFIQSAHGFLQSTFYRHQFR